MLSSLPIRIPVIDFSQNTQLLNFHWYTGKQWEPAMAMFIHCAFKLTRHSTFHRFHTGLSQPSITSRKSWSSNLTRIPTVGVSNFPLATVLLKNIEGTFPLRPGRLKAAEWHFNLNRRCSLERLRGICSAANLLHETVTAKNAFPFRLFRYEKPVASISPHFFAIHTENQGAYGHRSSQPIRTHSLQDPQSRPSQSASKNVLQTSSALPACIQYHALKQQCSSLSRLDEGHSKRTSSSNSD